MLLFVDGTKKHKEATSPGVVVVVRSSAAYRSTAGRLWPLMQRGQHLASSSSTGYTLVKRSIVATFEFCSGSPSIPKVSPRSPRF